MIVMFLLGPQVTQVVPDGNERAGATEREHNTFYQSDCWICVENERERRQEGVHQCVFEPHDTKA